MKWRDNTMPRTILRLNSVSNKWCNLVNNAFHFLTFAVDTMGSSEGLIEDCRPMTLMRYGVYLRLWKPLRGKGEKESRKSSVGMCKGDKAHCTRDDRGLQITLQSEQ